MWQLRTFTEAYKNLLQHAWNYVRLDYVRLHYARRLNLLCSLPNNVHVVYILMTGTELNRRSGHVFPAAARPQTTDELSATTIHYSAMIGRYQCGSFLQPYTIPL